MEIKLKFSFRYQQSLELFYTQVDRDKSSEKYVFSIQIHFIQMLNFLKYIYG